MPVGSIVVELYNSQTN